MTFIKNLRRELGEKPKPVELRGVYFSKIPEGTFVDLDISKVLSVGGVRIAVSPLNKVDAVANFLKGSTDGWDEALEKLQKAGATEIRLSHAEQRKPLEPLALAR